MTVTYHPAGPMGHGFRIPNEVATALKYGDDTEVARILDATIAELAARRPYVTEEAIPRTEINMLNEGTTFVTALELADENAALRAMLDRLRFATRQAARIVEDGITPRPGSASADIMRAAQRETAAALVQDLFPTRQT